MVRARDEVGKWLLYNGTGAFLLNSDGFSDDWYWNGFILMVHAGSAAGC